jgi:hypothetical protein
LVLVYQAKIVFLFEFVEFDFGLKNKKKNNKLAGA